LYVNTEINYLLIN